MRSDTLLHAEQILQIRKNEPLSFKGLKIYPLTVARMEEFKALQAGLTVRQSTLPLKYMVMDYASALFCMENDLLQNGEEGIGLFAAFLRLILLSLRIDGEETKSLPKMLKITLNEKGDAVLEGIHFTQDGKTVFCTANEISGVIRPYIAALNGICLPDESENTDLVKDYALKKKITAQDIALDEDLDDLFATVAYLYKIRVRDLMDWTVREFMKAVGAIKREKLFSAYITAELSGMVEFKKGNPVPSLFYDRLDESLGTVAMSEIGKNLGKEL